MSSKRQAFLLDDFQQRGFTLVELVGVIVLLGILSIMALPRFINLSADAHSATLQNLMGTLRSTITMVNIGCQLTPDCLDAGWGAIVYIPAVNKHVRMLNGYPDGGDPNRSVVFVGAIYDADVVSALRFYSRFYIHGHQVGGTNPSLVEALGAGNPVLAHDNEFNRWVAKGGAVYFNDIEIADKLIGELFSSEDKINQLKEATKLNFKENFHWDDILAQYADLLTLRHP